VCAVAEAASVACAIDTAATVLERILHEAIDAQVNEASYTLNNTQFKCNHTHTCIVLMC
jgi:hypothetical protein